MKLLSTPAFLRGSSSNQLVIHTTTKISQFCAVYDPLIEEFKRQVLSMGMGDVTICLDVLNVQKTKMLFELFKFMKQQQESGAMVKVYWEVEVSNIMMLETAMDFAQLYQLEVVISLV